MGYVPQYVCFYYEVGGKDGVTSVTSESGGLHDTWHLKVHATLLA